MARREQWSVSVLTMFGDIFRNNRNVVVLIDNQYGQAVICGGTTANKPDGVAGYAVGCLYVASDTGVVYVNQGSTTSCKFNALGTYLQAKSLLNDTSTGTSTITLTAAQAYAGYLYATGTKTGGFAIQYPTAAAIQALASFNATVGSWFDLLIFNSTSQTATLTGGSGVTVKGTATLATAKTARITFINTGAGAVDAFGIVSA
jgi:hypothetical protein